MIKEAIRFTDPEKGIVDTFNSLPTGQQLSCYWEDPNVEPVRAVIKKHYRVQQSYRCCYCQREFLSNHGRLWDVEHIVAKSTYPRFLFEPKNLAVACVDCNMEKGDKRVLENPKRVTYPIRSSDYLIIHPHFDEYEEHIEVEGLIYKSLSPKGCATIAACRLTRFNYAYLGYDETLAGSKRLDDYGKAMDGTDLKAVERMVRTMLAELRQRILESQTSASPGATPVPTPTPTIRPKGRRKS